MTTTTLQKMTRHASERGRTRISWLESYHTFSFGDYYDPRYMGFGDLRVINDDTVAPAGGFSTHGHRDMEIITVVLGGQLSHQDSLGNGSVIRPGEVQRMSAGTGVRHSEFNPSPTEPVHLLQIWILPEAKGIQPEYEQRAFSDAEKQGRWRLIGSHNGRDGSITIHQDVELYATILDAGQKVEYAVQSERRAWIQVAVGTVEVNGEVAEAGSGFGIAGQAGTLVIEGLENRSQVLLFNLKA